MFNSLPQPGPEECLIRIYVIKATELQPADSNGKVRLSFTIGSS